MRSRLVRLAGCATLAGLLEGCLSQQNLQGLIDALAASTIAALSQSVITSLLAGLGVGT